MSGSSEEPGLGGDIRRILSGIRTLQLDVTTLRTDVTTLRTDVMTLTLGAAQPAETGCPRVEAYSNYDRCGAYFPNLDLERRLGK